MTQDFGLVKVRWELVSEFLEMRIRGPEILTREVRLYVRTTHNRTRCSQD
jgi:hypothetical protein